MKKNIKKIICAVLLVVMSAVSLSGCGSADTAGGGSKYIYLTYNTSTDTFKGVLSKAIVSSAADENVTVDVYDGTESIDEQIEKIKEFVQSGYDGIIVQAVDAGTAKQIEIAAGDLPVVFINNKPDDDLLKADKYVYTGSEETQAGELQAQWVMEKLGNPSELNAIILKGVEGHAATIGRTKAVKYTLRAAGIKVNYVFNDYASWSDTEAADLMKTFFRTGQNVDVVFCNNDTMALGVVEAFKENGVDYSNIPICGVDATEDGCASIKAGEMSMTVLQDAEGQANAAVKAIKRLSNGKSIGDMDGALEDCKAVIVPFSIVDASNVSQY
ncbi:MAG: substrate-binding domain-containing protein [Lachnospiraceae bacterium]|nr:substrate-binding domain-containing protein [Lachnospiraceae bacterium]